MRKIRIIEKSDTKSFQGMPLSYRVSIVPRFGTKHPITITREFFRAGFNDGESFGKFFFQNNGDGGINRASFLSRKVKDADYLRRKEEEMIKIFFKKCVKSVTVMDDNLTKEVKRLKGKKNSYLKTMDGLDNYFRSEKIQKIKDVIENDK